MTPFSPQLTFTDPPGRSAIRCAAAESIPGSVPAPKDADFPAAGAGDHVGADGPVQGSGNLQLEPGDRAPGGVNWLVRAAYVGSHCSHLKEAIELNPAIYIPGSTISTDQRRLFQGFQFISLASSPGNAQLQLNATGPGKAVLAAALRCQPTTRWRRVCDNVPFANGAGGPADGGSYVYPWYFPNADLLDRGPSDFDIRHRFVTSYVWQLAPSRGIERVGSQRVSATGS